MVQPCWRRYIIAGLGNSKGPPSSHVHSSFLLKDVSSHLLQGFSLPLAASLELKAKTNSLSTLSSHSNRKVGIYYTPDHKSPLYVRLVAMNGLVLNLSLFT